jgi:hypothetical protein
MTPLINEEGLTPSHDEQQSCATAADRQGKEEEERSRSSPLREEEEMCESPEDDGAAAVYPNESLSSPVCERPGNITEARIDRPASAYGQLLHTAQQIMWPSDTDRSLDFSPERSVGEVEHRLGEGSSCSNKHQDHGCGLKRPASRYGAGDRPWREISSKSVRIADEEERKNRQRLEERDRCASVPLSHKRHHSPICSIDSDGQQRAGSRTGLRDERPSVVYGGQLISPTPLAPCRMTPGASWSDTVMAATPVPSPLRYQFR